MTKQGKTMGQPWVGKALALLTFAATAVACSAIGTPGENAAPVSGPTSSGELATSSSAEPTSPPSSIASASSSSDPTSASTGSEPPPAAVTASSKPVPERPCTRDGECGENRFCDRGHCIPVSSYQHSYGWPCQTNNSGGCHDLPCVDGRCRSCRSDKECKWVPKLVDPRCIASRSTPGTQMCNSGIPSYPGGIGTVPPPRP